jgi:hypothetical protein
MNGWGLLSMQRQDVRQGYEDFYVPSLEGYHDFPAIPQFIDKFIILILPVPGTPSVDGKNSFLITRLPNSSHHRVRLCGNRPSVRIDVHGELIQVLEDSE